VPCTITLPDKGKWMRLNQAGKVLPIKTNAAGQLTDVHIGNELVNGKPIIVRCVR
jgi:hypothetical protein